MRKNYSQDSQGQWWYQPPGRGRCRAREQKCKQCGTVSVSHHKEREFCSTKCVQQSQKGIPKVVREPRVCSWCKREFIPRFPSSTVRYCSRRCGQNAANLTRGRKGPLNAKWKGGVKSHSGGYIREWVPERGYLLQHRVVMERMLGRELKRSEQVHHKNGNRADNRIENLELWVTKQPPGQRPNEQQHCPTCTCNGVSQ
jgi:hypothetical protein